MWAILLTLVNKELEHLHLSFLLLRFIQPSSSCMYADTSYGLGPIH